MAELIVLLVVFAATGLVSLALISGIPQMLHTPLMSMTNALSAVTILGALTLFGSQPVPSEALLGALALVLAAFNLAGGFAITERMLRFFRKA